MKDTNICIGALGMVSSLGHDVVTSCAAARARMSQPSELNVLGQPFGKLTLDGPPVIHGHRVTGIGDGFSGIGKVLALGAAALRDLLKKRPIDPREATQTGILLCLADHALIDAHEAQLSAGLESSGQLPSIAWRERTAGVTTRLAAQVELDVKEPHCTVLTLGSPGFARALQSTTAEIAQGSVDRYLVGAVDSRIEPRFLTAAAGLEVLRTNDRPVGLIGGEAAAFVLLERERDLRAAGREPLAFFSGFGFATEPTGHFEGTPATGRALAEAILAALAAGPSLNASLSLMIGDLNGTERRAYEWGSALTRLRAGDAGVDLPAWYPATSFGDTGAAAGAISLCVATRAFQRGYAPGRGALIWTQSESGASAAFRVEAGR